MKNAGEDLVKSEKYDDAIYVFEAFDESEKMGIINMQKE